MPDAVTPAAAPVRSTNPANAPGAVVSSTPHRGAVAAARAKAGRGDTLRMIEAGQLDAAAPPSVPAPKSPAPGKSAPPVAEPASEPEDAPAGDADETEDQVDPDAQVETEAEPEAPAAAPEPTDPETRKRLATIQAAERRSREKAARERAELDTRVKRIETEWAPRIKAAESFEALQAKAAKARSNPALLADVFRGLGFADDHFEVAAQALYAMSKTGQADPARKAQAEQLLRAREEADRVDATQRRLDELEAKLSTKDQQAELQRLQAGYLDEAIEAISPTAAPIAAKALANIEAARALGTPDGKKRAAALTSKLRSKLWAITAEMTAELDGDVPELADVIKRYEDTRGAELDELGIPRPTATTTKPKTNSQPADKTNPARTLSNDLSTTRVPRPAQSGDASRKDSRKETLRMLDTGKLE